MLLRFGVENHRSIKERQELSFVATSQTDEPAYRHPAVGVSGADHGILPVLALYGANAAGKSNVVSALRLFRDHVAHSFTRIRPNQAIPHAPWRLLREGEASNATTFDADLLVDGVRHHYGFRFTSAGFVEEWLHRWPHGRQQVVYERHGLSDAPWYFGPSLTGPKAAIAEATRPNALFLSAAAQFNHPELGAVYRAIVRGIQRETIIELSGHALFVPDSPLLLPERRPLVLQLLRSADLGVHEFQVEEVGEQVRAELTNAEDLPDGFELPETLYELRLLHGDAGDPWTLPPEFESRGTQILLPRLNDVIASLLGGYLLVIDEIDTSLHPDLCRAIAGLFTSPDVNRHGAQLLFTTHDRDLLSVLRRDEVVLLDKGRDGVTRWVAASDFRDLRKSMDKRKVHEAGRLGGVPVIPDLARVWSAQVAPAHPEDAGV